MKQKISILVLMVMAVFSSHARKLIQISTQADSSAGVEIPCDGPGSGASCT